MSYPEPFDLKRLKVYPLADRHSMSRVEDILVEPANTLSPSPGPVAPAVQRCARNIQDALARKAGVMLIYGAHLIKNGGQLLLNQMIAHG